MLRAYALAMIMLQEKNDVFVRQKLQEVRNYPLSFIEGNIRTEIWDRFNGTVDMDTLRAELQEFRIDPLLFARRYSISPWDGIVDSAGTNNYELITVPNNKLIDSMVLSPHSSGAFQLRPAPKTAQARGVPIYFLPWMSLRIVGLTIPMAAQSNIFFTAAINGCSVFIEGPQNSPTIYHAGLTGEMFAPSSNPNIQIAINNPNPITRAGDVWREVYWSVSPLVARPNRVGFSEVEKRRYVNDGSIDKLGGKTTSRAIDFRVALESVFGQDNIFNFAPSGCVFGTRNTATGNWTFYLQRNATIYYRSPIGDLVTSRPIRVTEIFPTFWINHFKGINNRRAPETALPLGKTTKCC